MRSSFLIRDQAPGSFAREVFATATRSVAASHLLISKQLSPAFPRFDFGPDFNVADLAMHQPPRYRPIRRLRYYWHLEDALLRCPHRNARSEFQSAVDALYPSWSATGMGIVATTVISTWALLWPCVGVPLLLLLGWGAARQPGIDFYDGRLLPVQPNELISAMSSNEDFVVLEGPKGTAKTTLIQLASRAEGVTCPLYLHVNFDAGKTHHILHSIARRFWIIEAQAYMTLYVLRAIGRPVHLFIDIEGKDVDLVQLTKHVKSLIADEGQPLLQAVIASSDGKTALLSDPRMIRISASEVDVATATRHLEAQGCDVPPEVLARFPRTPLGLKRLKREFDARGLNGVRRVVDKALKEAQVQVTDAVHKCEDKKKFLLLASQPDRSFSFAEVQTICGESGHFARRDLWEQEVVLNRNLFRPMDSGYIAQFDQHRDACRRVAEELPPRSALRALFWRERGHSDIRIWLRRCGSVVERPLLDRCSLFG